MSESGRFLSGSLTTKDLIERLAGRAEEVCRNACTAAGGAGNTGLPSMWSAGRGDPRMSTSRAGKRAGGGIRPRAGTAICSIRSA